MKLHQLITEGPGKSIKRATRLWDKSSDIDPKTVKQNVKNMSDEELKSLLQDPIKAGKDSPQDLQQKLIRRELKRRGLRQYKNE